MPSACCRFASRFVALASTLVLILSLTLPSPGSACGGTWTQPSCGRTVVITAGIPNTLLSSGGAFDVPVLVYFNLAEFPVGPALCPTGPFEVDVDLTITCTPSGDGGGTMVDLPIELGYTAFDIPVVLPPGPPRICTVNASATVSAPDGSAVTNTNERIQLCLVDESPSQPGLPRLDLELLGPDPLLPVHPGDQSSHTWRITNRDPSATFTGELEVVSENQSRLPTATDIVSPFDGVFAGSDPGLGDNFPIAFADEVESCVPLPVDPLLPVVPTLTRPLVIPPGGFEDIEILTRPWGMCADGSCSQSTAVIDGDFSDLTAGFACGSFGTVTDLTVPPGFEWPDTGSSALFLAPVDPLLGEIPFAAQPTLDLPPSPFLFIQPPSPQLIPQGQPPVQGDLFADQTDPERGRIQATFQPPNPIQPGNPFDLVLPLLFLPNPKGDIVSLEMRNFELVVGAPSGFEFEQPLFMGTMRVETLLGGQTLFHELDILLQLGGIGLDPGGDPLGGVGFQNPQVFPLPPDPQGGVGVELHLQGIMLPPSPPGASTPGAHGPGAVELRITQDLRAHASQGVSVFDDGFETGDTSRWSSTSP